MREALNGFVIRGISSNIPFQAALLAHPDFVTGNFNTGFIAEHYPNGFTLADANAVDRDLLAALAIYVHRRARVRATLITGQMAGRDYQPRQVYAAMCLGEGGQIERKDVRAVPGDSKREMTLEVNGKSYAIDAKWQLGEIRVHGTINDEPFTAQVERGTAKNPLAIRVIYNGSQLDVLPLVEHTADLYAHMPYKAPPDMSKFVLSPMPGLLVDVAVQPGQKVEAGERVAVIEAMKMENVLFATADGVVKAVKAAKGESLAVDQPIVEFE
jgi:propionyl-CoA carboxylase alpha chain